MEDADRDEEEIAVTPAVRGEEEIAETPAVRGRFPPLEEEDGSTCVIMSCVESVRFEKNKSCAPTNCHLSRFSFAPESSSTLIHIIHISIRY